MNNMASGICDDRGVATTGLLAIDLQRVFADPDSPWHVPAFAQVSAATAQLLEAYGARAAATRFVPHADPTGSWRDYYEAFPFARDPDSQHLWELVPEVLRHDPVVVDAPTMGKWTTEARSALGDPSTVVLCGVATECCVLATALAASDAGVRVRLVADACAGGTAETHAATLEVLGAFAPQVQVVTLDEALVLA